MQLQPCSFHQTDKMVMVRDAGRYIDGKIKFALIAIDTLHRFLQNESCKREPNGF
jgi:hypothetical protein